MAISKDNITEAINILATSVLNFIRKKHTLVILWFLTYSWLLNKSVGLKLKPAFLYVEHWKFYIRIFKYFWPSYIFQPNYSNIFYNITCLENTFWGIFWVFLNNFVIQKLMCKSDQMLPLLCIEWGESCLLRRKLQLSSLFEGIKGRVRRSRQGSWPTCRWGPGRWPQTRSRRWTSWFPSLKCEAWKLSCFRLQIISETRENTYHKKKEIRLLVAPKNPNNLPDFCVQRIWNFVLGHKSYSDWDGLLKLAHSFMNCHK